MYKYNKTQVSPYDPAKLATHSILRAEDDLVSNSAQTVKKTVSFDDIVHFVDIKNIMTDVSFDCAVTFYPETPRKNRQIKRKRNHIPRSCQKVKCIPSNDQRNCSFDEQHTCKIFLKPYNLRDMVPAAPMSLNHTNDRDSMSNQYPQPTTHQYRRDSYPVLFSLRTMGSRRKRMLMSFAFFQNKYLPDRRENETVAAVEELSDLWKPGAMDGIPPFVMNCVCI